MYEVFGLILKQSTLSVTKVSDLAYNGFKYFHNSLMQN